MKQPDTDVSDDELEKPAGSGRDETEKERIDRNVIELLNELRVALPGVQVLFAFLLVLPFNQGFTSVTQFQKNVYLVTLLATALATVMLIAPSMHHRLQFREGNKAKILRDSNRLTVLGMSTMAIAMVGAVMLCTDYVFSSETMAWAVGIVTLAFLIIWYAIPIQRLLSDRREDANGD
jgi:uncharacterized protein involved in cysteine biosynthesis